MISEHSKWAVDKLTPTSQSTQSTVEIPQGRCSIGTYGEERPKTGQQMKIKK